MAVEHLLRRAGVRKSYLPEGAHIKHDLQQIYLLVEANNHGISDLADQLESLQSQINQNRTVDSNILSRVDAAITSISGTTTNLLTELSRLEGSVKGIREDTHPGTSIPQIPGLMYPPQPFFTGASIEGITSIQAKVEILTAAINNLRTAYDSIQKDGNSATSSQISGMRDSVTRSMQDIKTTVDDIKEKYHDLALTLAQLNKDILGLAEVVKLAGLVKTVITIVLEDKGYNASTGEKLQKWDRFVNLISKKAIDVIVSIIVAAILTWIANAYLKSTSEKLRNDHDIVEKLRLELDNTKKELQLQKERSQQSPTQITPQGNNGNGHTP